MPQVGKKHFPYTKKGYKQAMKKSKKTGDTIEYTKKGKAKK
jgi:hypothetical protein